MGRPQRNNVDYFPHFIGEGKKMFYIEQKYGNDGYACWFKILEKLASTNFHFLNLNDESEVMFLAAKCRVEEGTLIKIINDLSKVGAINPEMWKVNIVWSDQFIDSIRDVYLKRSNSCQSLEGLRSHLMGLGILKGPVNPQTKLNYTKLKESKEKLLPSFVQFLPPKIEENVQKEFIENFDRWLEHLIHKRKDLGDETIRLLIERLFRESKGNVNRINEIINFSIEKDAKNLIFDAPKKHNNLTIKR